MKHAATAAKPVRVSLPIEVPHHVGMSVSKHLHLKHNSFIVMGLPLGGRSRRLATHAAACRRGLPAAACPAVHELHSVNLSACARKANACSIAHEGSSAEQRFEPRSTAVTACRLLHMTCGCKRTTVPQGRFRSQTVLSPRDIPRRSQGAPGCGAGCAAPAPRRRRAPRPPGSARPPGCGRPGRTAALPGPSTS